MKMENRIRILAGTFVLLSVSLGHLVSTWWLLLAAIDSFLAQPRSTP